MIKCDDTTHKLLALYAAECAEHVLVVFGQACPQDFRPREAIETARHWAKGKISIGDARKAAFAAHAAAREAAEPFAKFAARAAGHAAATAHVNSHAKHAAVYAIKASQNAMEESAWQKSHCPVDIIPCLSSQK